MESSRDRTYLNGADGSAPRAVATLAAALAVAAAMALVVAPSAFGWSARTVAGLTSGGGSGGPLVPEVQGVVLDGQNGLSTSLRPSLRWPDGPGGQKNYEIRDLSGKSLWRFSGAGDARVSAGVLKQGGAYTWRASGDGKSFDGGLFRVDMQRPGVQAATQFGNVVVGAVSGEGGFSWSSQRLGSAAGPVGFSLAFQPSNTQLLERQPGIPSGWQLTAGGGSEWNRLKLVSEQWAELISNTGVAVPFARGSGGLWVAQLGEGQGWPAGSQVSLARADDGTWSATDRNGVVTLFPALTKAGSSVYARKVWAANEPSFQQVFDSSGRLTALQDQISGRFIRFIYRGVNETSDLKCVEAEAAHMNIAPEGYLCLTSGWEQPRSQPTSTASAMPQRNRIFYSTQGSRPALARIVGDSQAGGQLASVTDIAYDAVGRLKALRSPLASQAVAAGILPGKPAADDPNVLTTVSYDGEGRVSRVTRPAPLSCCGRTGEPAFRSFKWSGTGSPDVTQEVRGPGSSRLGQTTSHRSTMFATRAVDSAGRATTTQWDAQLEAPVQVDSPGGLRQVNRYDALGNMIEQRGPSADVDSDSAPVSRTSFDTEMRGTDEVPMRGLQVMYYKGRQFQGGPLSHQTGPKIGSQDAVASLQFSWPSSPVGSTLKDWSARLFGYVRMPADGDFSFTSATGTSLWISGQLCSPTCQRQGLKEGQLLPIQIQVVSGERGTGSVSASWSGPGASGAIPTNYVRPGYTRPARQKVTEALSPGAGSQELGTAITYSASSPNKLLSVSSTSGRTAQKSYEPFNPQGGQFGRPTGSVTAAGLQTGMTYYGQRDIATVPNGCPNNGGESFDQAGLARERTLQGGLDTKHVYDSAGRVVAQRQNGELASCQSFNAAGDPVSSFSPASGGSSASTVTTTYNAGGNPLVTESVASQEGTRDRKVRTRVDILGRTIASTDVWNTTTTNYYDSYDRVTRAVSKTGSGQETSTEATYNDAGDPLTIKIDGKLFASYSYNDSGQATSIGYGNGAKATLEYDSTGNLKARTLKIGDREISESVGLSPGGRVLSRSMNAPGTDASWGYTYDRDGRLTSAELAGTVPNGVATGTWAYELDAASRRIAITRPGTGPGTGRVTFDYGEASEIEGTSDTRFGAQDEAQFDYDSRDRATKAGPLRFKYDSTDEVREIDDGTTTVAYQLAAGTTIGQTITTTDPQTGEKSSRSVRYSAQGLVLCPKCEAGSAFYRIVDLGGGVSVQLPLAPAKKASPRKPAAKKSADASGTDASSADEIARESQAPTADTWRYQDILGNVAWKSEGGSAPESTTLYDPEGNQLTELPALSFDPINPNLRFEGQSVTPTSIPTIAMGSRTYIPALGLMMQPDPVPNAGPTPYNYANGDPVNFQDPNGDVSWCWSTFTKVTTAVVVGAVVGVFTAGVGSSLAVGYYIAAQAAIGAAAGAAGSAIGQGIVIGAGIKDSDGNVSSQLNWGEFWRDAAIGAAANGVSAGLTRKLAPRPGASGVSKAPTKAVVPGKGVLRPAGSTLAVKETRMLLVDGATNPLLGKPAKSVGWINAGGEPVSQVNVFAKRTAQENHALFGGIQQQIAKNQAAQRQQLLHEFQDEYAIRQDF